MSCLWYCPLYFRGVFVSELNKRECDKAISASDLRDEVIGKWILED